MKGSPCQRSGRSRKAAWPPGPHGVPTLTVRTASLLGTVPGSASPQATPAGERTPLTQPLASPRAGAVTRLPRPAPSSHSAVRLIGEPDHDSVTLSRTTAGPVVFHLQESRGPVRSLVNVNDAVSENALKGPSEAGRWSRSQTFPPAPGPSPDPPRTLQGHSAGLPHLSSHTAPAPGQTLLRSPFCPFCPRNFLSLLTDLSVTGYPF